MDNQTHIPLALKIESGHTHSQIETHEMQRKCKKRWQWQISAQENPRTQAVTTQLLNCLTLLFYIHTAVFTLGKTYKRPPHTDKYLLSQAVK